MEPFFIDSDSRRLFCLYFPAMQAPVRRRVLIVPPFAEELNKCRRVLNLTARRLAAEGCDVLLPDLFATGDSSGNLSEVEWQDWLDDCANLDRWLRGRSSASEQAYLAVRTGALLLANAGPNLADFAQAIVVLWQPVADGARFLQQFLRMRVMADRMSGGTESVADLERRLGDGESIEVAGYMLAPALAAGLASSKLDCPSMRGVRNLHVFEFKSSASADSELTAPIAAFVNACGAQGRVLACDQFWATQEVSAPVVVVVATTQALA